MNRVDQPSPGGRVTGWAAALGSAAAFGSSGSFARPLLDAGWSSSALVTLRIGLASLVLLLPALWVMRRRWTGFAAQLPWLLTYGLFAAAAVQVAFFNAVQSIPVGIAILLEYLGVVWVVLWDWLRSQHQPRPVTLVGMAAALVGLIVVIDPFAEVRLNLTGVLWGLLAGVGLAVYFVVSAQHEGLPPVAFVCFGLGIGAITLLLLGTLGVLPFTSAFGEVQLLGSTAPWWLPAAELVLIAAAAAYLLGFVGAQFLGSTLASFVGLTEVLFAILWAWWVLAERPSWVQALGGAILVGGVALVQWGRSAAVVEPGVHADETQLT